MEEESIVAPSLSPARWSLADHVARIYMDSSFLKSAVTVGHFIYYVLIQSHPQERSTLHYSCRSNMSLTASYTSPSSTQTFVQSLPPIPEASDTKSKTAYLGALKSSVQGMQEEINTFLTLKMEEDRLNDRGAAQGLRDERKEEENYGEEAVDDD